MEFFTALLIYYPLQDMDMRSEIWFENYAKCEQVLRSDALLVIYDNPKDVHMNCTQSDQASSSIRPKARPKGLGYG